MTDHSAGDEICVTDHNPIDCKGEVTLFFNVLERDGLSDSAKIFFIHSWIYHWYADSGPRSEDQQRDLGFTQKKINDCLYELEQHNLADLNEHDNGIEYTLANPVKLAEEAACRRMRRRSELRKAG